MVSGFIIMKLELSMRELKNKILEQSPRPAR